MIGWGEKTVSVAVFNDHDFLHDFVVHIERMVTDLRLDKETAMPHSKPPVEGDYGAEFKDRRKIMEYWNRSS